MKKWFTPVFFLFSVLTASAQMGIGTSTPHPGAALDIESYDKALLIPRVTEANRPGMYGKDPVTTGMMVYQTDGIQGFYLYNWDGWMRITEPSRIKPQGFGYAVTNFQANYVLNVQPIFPAQIPLWVEFSNGDVLSNDSFYVTIDRDGIYSFDYEVTPLSVTGNQYQVLLNVANNPGHTNGVARGSVQVSSAGNPKVQGRAMLYALRGTRISLLVLPYPNTNPTALTFGNGDYQHGVSLKITREF